jgi:rare lipoprotein A
MSSISHHGCVEFVFGRITRGRSGLRSVRSGAQALLVAAVGAMLAACTQTAMVPQKQAVAMRAPATQPSRMASSVVRRPVALARRHAPMSVRKNASTMQAEGVASFYQHGEVTANGEKFDPQQLTAAHRTLPFGTRLKVTNLTTGQSVTVRINDRGPFIPGRIVDVSVSAAESLGMTSRGLAKVKLDVVD